MRARAYEISLKISAIFSSIEQYCTSTFYLIRSEMPSKIQSKNVDFCCAIFICVCLHSERYKKLYIKRSFEVILYHIAGETGTKQRIVERCVFNRTMAAYSISKHEYSMPFCTKTAGFQTWEQEELNSAQFKTYVYIEIFYSANLGNVVKRKSLVATAY